MDGHGQAAWIVAQPWKKGVLICATAGIHHPGMHQSQRDNTQQAPAVTTLIGKQEGGPGLGGQTGGQ